MTERELLDALYDEYKLMSAKVFGAKQAFNIQLMKMCDQSLLRENITPGCKFYIKKQGRNAYYKHLNVRDDKCFMYGYYETTKGKKGVTLHEITQVFPTFDTADFKRCSVFKG